MMNGKATVDSKTVILNAIMMVILIAEVIPLIWQDAYTLPAWVLPVSATVVAVGNIVLRVWFTQEPITSFLRK